MDETTIDLKIIFYIILRRIGWIISSTILGAVLAIIITVYVITPKYTSSISLYVSNITDTTEQSIPGTANLGDMNASQRLVNTYIVILQEIEFLEEVSNQLSVNYTPGQIRNAITMSSARDTWILKITVTTDSPELSAEICNTLALAAPEAIKSIEENQMGSIRKIGTARPSYTPSSPSRNMNMFLGAVAGLVLSLAIVFLIYFLDNTIKDTEDLKSRIVDVPILGEIPSMTDNY